MIFLSCSIAARVFELLQLPNVSHPSGGSEENTSKYDSRIAPKCWSVMEKSEVKGSGGGIATAESEIPAWDQQKGRLANHWAFQNVLGWLWDDLIWACQIVLGNCSAGQVVQDPWMFCLNLWMCKQMGQLFIGSKMFQTSLIWMMSWTTFKSSLSLSLPLSLSLSVSLLIHTIYVPHNSQYERSINLCLSMKILVVQRY